MLVLGIDPGIAITGFGLVEIDSSGDTNMVAYGVIDGTAERNTSSRLVYLFDQLSALVAEYKPDSCGVEKLFFQKNTKTAMAVSEARGVIMLCLTQALVPISEFTPSEIKSAVTSYGNASKGQVQEMVKILLGLEKIPRPDDAADALAVALCCANTQRFTQSVDESQA